MDVTVSNFPTQVSVSETPINVSVATVGVAGPVGGIGPVGSGGAGSVSNIVTGSGIQNYIPKFTFDGSGLIDSNIYDLSGKIGINTTNPTYLLHVDGPNNIKWEEIAFFRGGNAGGANAGAVVAIQPAAASNRWDGGKLYGGRWGTNNGGLRIYGINWNNITGLAFDLDARAGYFMFSGGNVGIKTITSPISALDVSGHIHASGGRVLTIQESGDLQVQIDLERNKNTITGVSISGGVSITGAFNITAGSNVTLTQQGNNTLQISATAGSSNLNGLISTGDADNRYLSSGVSGYFYPWSNPNNFLRSGDVTQSSTSGLATSGNLETTGTALQNQINLERSKNTVTGIRFSGSGWAFTGEIFITGVGNVSIQNSGDIIFISGNTGFLSDYYKTYNPNNFIRSGDFSLNGLISTGSADLRYLQTGVSGEFYKNSNPLNFSSSGNVENTGSALVGLLNNYYLKNNPNQFATSGNLETSGTSLQNQINTINNLPKVTGILLSGSGQSLTGQILLTGINNISVSNSGNIVFISGTYNLNGLATSGNLESTGTQLQNQLGNYYLNSNPSNYIKSGDVDIKLVGLANTGYVNSTSGSLSERLSQTGTIIIGLIDAASAGVSSINGQSGILTLAGSNNIAVTTAGQNITVSGPKSVVTGIMVSGSGIAATGEIYITGLGNVEIKSSGNFVFVNGIPANLTGLSKSGESFIINAITGLGTVYYVPKFTTNGSGLINSNIIDSGNSIVLGITDTANSNTGILYIASNGNVGINSYNPSEKLTISGGNLLFTTSGLFSGPSVPFIKLKHSDQTEGIIGLQGTSWSTLGFWRPGLSVTSTPNLAIGNSLLISTPISEFASAIRLYGRGDSAPAGVQIKNDAASATIHSLVIDLTNGQTSNLQVWRGSGSNPVLSCVNYTGWFGIANSAPIAPLDVSGNIYALGGKVLTSQDSGNILIIIENTGTSLQNQINTERNKNTITGISVSGGLSITGAFNINAGTNITLTQQGTNTLSISAAAGTTNIVGLISTGDADLRYLASGCSGEFLKNSNLNGLVNSGQLESTGTSLQNQITILNNLPKVTGIMLSGSGTALTGNILFTGINNISISNSGNIIFVSGTYNLNGLSTSGNLESTGTALQNQVTSIKNGTGVFIQNSNLNGLISTGQGDLRYLQTGVSGEFYKASNPAGYITTSNLNGLITTGSADLRYLQTGVSGEFYKASNPAGYITTSNLVGLANSGNFISGVSITGGIAIQGALNINAGNNITLTQAGANSFTIASTAAGGSLGGVTGITISGSTAISGAIQFIGAYGTNVIHSGNSIAISGGGGGPSGPVTNNYYVINSGSGIFLYKSGITNGVDKQFFTFPELLTDPTVLASVSSVTNDTVFVPLISGINTTGFWGIFPNTIDSTGYFLHIFAAAATGMAATVINNNITNNTVTTGTNITISGSSVFTSLDISGVGGITVTQTTSNKALISGRTPGLTYLIYNQETDGPLYRLSAALSGNNMGVAVIDANTINPYSKLIIESEVRSSTATDAAAKPLFTWQLGWWTGNVYYYKQFVHRIISATTAGVDGGGQYECTLKTVSTGVLGTTGTTIDIRAQCDTSAVANEMQVRSLRVYGVV